MYTVLSQKKSPTEGYLYEYVADTEEDLTTIKTERPETAQGSSVLIIEDSTVFMMGSDEEWHEI